MCRGVNHGRRTAQVTRLMFAFDKRPRERAVNHRDRADPPVPLHSCVRYRLRAAIVICYRLRSAQYHTQVGPRHGFACLRSDARICSRFF